MSVAGIRSEIDGMTDDQRRELAGYLKERWRRDDPEWAAELARRCAAVEAGRGHSQEAVMRVHQELLAKGR